MKVYDNYEISPCRRFEEPDRPGVFYFEVCEPEEADVWTLYGHTEGEGAQAIGDFPSRECALEVYSRITGLPFPESREPDSRLRAMHAGPVLLEAARLALRSLRISSRGPDEPVILALQAAIEQATGEPHQDDAVSGCSPETM